VGSSVLSKRQSTSHDESTDWMEMYGGKYATVSIMLWLPKKVEELLIAVGYPKLKG
jgi:hypothetical protein